jgi:hypothetical protein
MHEIGYRRAKVKVGTGHLADGSKDLIITIQRHEQGAFDAVRCAHEIEITWRGTRRSMRIGLAQRWQHSLLLRRTLIRGRERPAVQPGTCLLIFTTRRYKGYIESAGTQPISSQTIAKSGRGDERGAACIAFSNLDQRRREAIESQRYCAG